jgi:hypothetical protein
VEREVAEVPSQERLRVRQAKASQPPTRCTPGWPRSGRKVPPVPPRPKAIVDYNLGDRRH